MHHLQTHFGVNSADEHGLGAASRPAHGVDAAVKPVNEINIGVSRRTVHDTIARRLAAETVRGGIMLPQVSLDLDNSPAARTVRCIADQPMPQQEWRNDCSRRLIK